ncbi:hypothetical protein, partial [Paraburkholderia caribensis]|uniref:hypothetical protein n=1 Tax=Paraburkholderia caribensis TaxID=75105 RepID=UPI00209063EB
CLLFFAAAKKSRCRPAQGRRLKLDNASRMPAKAKAKRGYQRKVQTTCRSPKSKKGHTKCLKSKT